jgi:hypothetical protein
VTVEALGDGLMLIDLERGTTFRLNRTGKTTWELLGQQRTPAEIVGQMHVIWGVSAEQVERDVLAVVQDLLNNQLLDFLPEERREPGS